MDEKLFAVLVEEGIRRIPARFRRHLDDIAVVIEDAPSLKQAREMRLPRHADLFGLYEGTPRTERQYLPFHYPEKITIFRRAFERHCGSDENCIREEVAHTVWHELGHALGMSERQIRAAERRRRRPQT